MLATDGLSSTGSERRSGNDQADMSVSCRKLDLLTEKTRSKPISWDGYSRAGLISQQDVSSLNKVTAASAKSDLLDAENEGPQYAALYVRLLSKLSRNDTIAYVLVLVGDMLSDHEERIALFLQQADLFSTFSTLLSIADEFVRLKSAALLCTILSASDKTSADQTVILNLFQTLTKMLSGNAADEGQPSEADPETQLIALQCLSLLFKKSEYRQLAWSKEGQDKVEIVHRINEILRHSVAASSHNTGLVNSVANGSTSGTLTPRTNLSSSVLADAAENGNDHVASTSSPQLQYYLGLSLWILTFEPAVAQALPTKFPKVIPLLTELARNAVKEKVVRVVLAIFRNFAMLSPDNTLPVMLSCRLMSFLNLMTNSKKWSDEEIVADVEYLKAGLQDTKQTLSTFDEYQQELESGYLTWDSPTHTNDEFWRENAQRMTEQDDKCIKALVDSLSSTDPVILAVACNDIAYLVKYNEASRKVLDRLGAKTKVMELMNHPDANVKYKALMAVQRLVSHSWS